MDAPLEKIRALLAMAERGSTQAERDAFNEKAAALLAKYGVDRAMVDATAPKPEVVGDRIVRVSAPFGAEKQSLIGGIAYELGCRAVYLRRGSVREVHLFGFASDMERAEIMFTSLLMQSATELSRITIPWGAHAGAYKRSFLEGFVGIVRARLRLAEEKAQKDAQAENRSGPSVALVLVERVDRVARALEVAHPKVKVRKRTLGGAGTAEGQRAGLRANLSTTTNLGGVSRGELPRV